MVGRLLGTISNLLVVIQNCVHVLDPDGVHWAIKHNPLPVLISGRGLVLEGGGQHSIRPLVGDRVEAAIELLHRDGLGVDDAVVRHNLACANLHTLGKHGAGKLQL